MNARSDPIGILLVGRMHEELTERALRAGKISCC